MYCCALTGETISILGAVVSFRFKECTFEVEKINIKNNINIYLK